MPFEITTLQLQSANRLFPPLAVGMLPTALADVGTDVAIDATSDPGIELLATFWPAVPVHGGVRRIAATQIVTGAVSIDFSAVLPVSWLASVFRTGDIAPNQLAFPYSAVTDSFELPFEGELTVTHDANGWSIPDYDSGAFSVNVGFGFGANAIAWGYSVPCRPEQIVQLDVGSYQLVRSSGEDRIGDPVPNHLDSWTMPLGYRYALTFDQNGKGVLTRT